jgi:alkanesulfonate monooxygenase SsuD/methylene tetrahydromethanopterin reductase-like flavin-dependent oxidoreductase (luciferase family)
VADGLVGHPIYTRRYLREVVRPNLEIGFRRAGREASTFDLATYVITSISDDRDQAGFRTFDFEKMASFVTDEMVEEIAVTGTAEECREKLARWEGIVDTPLLYAPGVGVSPERLAENNRRIVATFGGA